MSAYKCFLKLEEVAGPIEYDGSKSWFDLLTIRFQTQKSGAPDKPNPGELAATKELDGSWQLFYQSLSKTPKVVTVVAASVDRVYGTKALQEIQRVELRDAKMLGTPTVVKPGDAQSATVMGFVLSSASVRIVKGSATDPALKEPPDSWPGSSIAWLVQQSLKPLASKLHPAAVKDILVTQD